MADSYRRALRDDDEMAASMGKAKSAPSKPRRARPLALIVPGMLWALPNTLAGLLIAAVGAGFGARLRWRSNELAWVVSHWPWGSGGALTLGNVIVHTGSQLETPCLTYAHRAGRGIEPPISLADHERAHVFQYMLLGPLFLPVYLLCGGISVRNPFERAADRYARSGTGWWPWSRDVALPQKDR